MATTKLNGCREQPPATQDAKCNCCPYGFHIDLGFIDYVEHVTNSASTGNAMNNGSLSQRSSLKKNGASSTMNRCNTADNLAKRVLLSPLDSIFSDSLENVVSDFEETLNSRGCNSDRESMQRLKTLPNHVKSNGYFSDYGSTPFSRSMPPRMPAGAALNGIADRGQISRPQALVASHHDAPTSSRKPPITSSGAQQHEYRTALGRTISEIKSKHHSENDDDLKRALLTPKGYRKRGISAQGRSMHFNSSSEFEHSHLLFDEGKTPYMGNKIPEISRRTFTINSSHELYPRNTESVQQPHWRIRSPVQRSCSTVDMDEFASMRRRKQDNGVSEMTTVATAAPPIPYPRNCSLYAERLRRELSSPPHLSTSPSSENFSTSKGLNEMKMFRENYNSIPRNRGVKELNADNVSAFDSETLNNKNIETNEPCLQCYSLQRQLSSLLLRLQQATDQMNDKAAEELKMKREKPAIVDKNIGSSYPILSDAAAETVKVESTDAASDALFVETADKLTIVSTTDRTELNWQNDTAISPIPQPRCYSIGVITDRSPEYSKCDAMTSTSFQELLAMKAINHAESSTDPISFKSCASGNDLPVLMRDFSSVTECAELVDSGTGSKQTISLLKDSSSMTSPVTLYSRSAQTVHVNTSTVCVSTSPVQLMNSGVDASKIIKKDSCTICDDLLSRNQRDTATEMDAQFGDQKETQQTVALQTEFLMEHSEPRILNDSEIAESLWLMPCRETKDAAVGNEEDVIEISELDFIEKNVNTELELGNSDDEDTICIVEETLSDPEAIDFECSKSAEQSLIEQRIADEVNASRTGITELKAPRVLGQARAAAVKKMLTEKSPPYNFIRGTATSKSWRTQSKKGDSLQYIADQHKTKNGSMPSTPQTTKGALKEKVILKKDITPSSIPASKVPEPVPARIPRPKISKYNPGETIPQSPDEEAEIADRLTPLRSEMRTLRTYSNGRVIMLPRAVPPTQNALPRTPPNYDKNKSDFVEDSSSSSSDSEGSYDTNEAGTAAHFEPTPQLNEAIEILKKHFQKPNSVDPPSVDWATKHAKHEWLKTAARKTASAAQVEGFVDYLEEASSDVLKFVVNLTDTNENTALHYAVSHGNFDVVSVLLDSRAFSMDRANKAGYTAVMLGALCDASDEVEAAVIHRLFQLGDVNAQAVQHGQTALMLAVSHGKINTTKLLIDCQADLNIQDEEGSTALMCAAEHGHKEIVKLLLDQPNIDASLSDCDSSTALSIAVENGHRDIGVLIYAHLNHACKKNQQSKESGP